MLALTLGALALRLCGIGFMLPHQPEPDAVIVWHAAWLERPAGAPVTTSAYLPRFYPSLLPDLLHLLPGSSYPRTLAADASIDEHVAVAAGPYLRGRYLVAVLSVLAIPAGYRIARAFLPRAPSLLAAALAATSLLSTSYAQQARPHAAVAAFSAVAVAAALAHARRGGWWSCAIASIATGLALGCLHNGVFAVPALLLACWLAPDRRAGQLALAVVTIVAAVCVFYAAMFQRGVVQLGTSSLGVGGQVVALERISPVGFLKIARGILGFEPVILALAIIGSLALARVLSRRRAIDRRALLVAAAYPVTFLVFWGSMVHMFPRFTVPLVPFLAVLGAGGAHALVVWLVPARARPVAFAAAAAISLAIPTWTAIRLVTLRARPDTYTLAARRIEAEADATRDCIAHEMLLQLPLVRARDSLAALPMWAHGPWDQYQLALAGSGDAPRWQLVPIYSKGAFRDKWIDHAEASAVLAEHDCRIGVATIPLASDERRDGTHAALTERLGAPVHRILPFDPDLPRLNGSGYEVGYHGVESVLRARYWGPPIDVFARARAEPHR